MRHLPPYFDRRPVISRPVREGPARLLAKMRIRKKLVVLHTVFSLALASILLISIRPAMTDVVDQAEMEQARVILDALMPSIEHLPGDAGALPAIEVSGVDRRSGTVSALKVDVQAAQDALANPGRAVITRESVVGPGAVAFAPAREGKSEEFHVLGVHNTAARRAAMQVYWLLVIALLAVYALVALALEIVVMPPTVYLPIQRMLTADAAVQSGRKDEELIPESAIPGDELGEIMRSRNESIIKLRQQEEALAGAIAELGRVANDLKRKNHLLETAQRNLAESDRLASLGMMSAGIAHELNTPLSVLKGLVEQINAQPARGVEPATAALMLRVVNRLEGLGESLLDFARVRPPSTKDSAIFDIVQEAITLVRLDRDSQRIDVQNRISPEMRVNCDPDRMVQVFVNLIRNAVDAVFRRTGSQIIVEAAIVQREERAQMSITVTDDGPGIDASVLPHLFEPFVSTRLDSRGTGLGLAVAEGIIREHGGLILARNRTDHSGAVFEVVLPA